MLLIIGNALLDDCLFEDYFDHDLLSAPCFVPADLVILNSFRPMVRFCTATDDFLKILVPFDARIIADESLSLSTNIRERSRLYCVRKSDDDYGPIIFVTNDNVCFIMRNGFVRFFENNQAGLTRFDIFLTSLRQDKTIVNVPLVFNANSGEYSI